jgi:hypothetical protein
MISLHRCARSTRALSIRLGFALLLAVTLAGNAGATTLQYVAGFAGPQSILLPQFDPALGTLVGATLELTAGSTTASVLLQNTDPSNPAIGDVLHDAFAQELNVSGHGFGFLTVGLSWNEHVELHPGETRLVSFAPQAGSDAASTGPDGYLIGTGPLYFEVAAPSLIDTFMPPTVNVLGQDPGAVSGTLSITYEYVPEPALASLAACVVLGLVVRRR